MKTSRVSQIKFHPASLGSLYSSLFEKPPKPKQKKDLVVHILNIIRNFYTPDHLASLG